MKVRITLEVGDELRRAIARVQANEPDPKRVRNQKGLATRTGVGRWVEEKVYKAENAAEYWLEPEKVSREDEAIARDAIAYLKAAGWEEERILRWLLGQRAYCLKLRKMITADVIPLRPR